MPVITGRVIQKTCKYCYCIYQRKKKTINVSKAHYLYSSGSITKCIPCPYQTKTKTFITFMTWKIFFASCRGRVHDKVWELPGTYSNITRGSDAKSWAPHSKKTKAVDGQWELIQSSHAHACILKMIVTSQAVSEDHIIRIQVYFLQVYFIIWGIMDMSSSPAILQWTTKHKTS